MTESMKMTCEQAREAIHDFLDAAAMEAGARQRLDAHLAVCTECRDRRAELATIQSAMRSLPRMALPDGGLRQVWGRTTQAEPQARGRRRGWRNLAAAAAVALVAVIGVVQWNGQLPPDPTQTELQRAAAEARAVLGLTSQALRKTEQAAFHGRLAGELSGALQRVPIAWPESSADR